MAPWLLAAALLLGPAAAASPGDGIVASGKKKPDGSAGESRQDKKDKKQDRRQERREDRGERREDRRDGRLLRRNLPESARPVRTLLVPGAGFNTDDGLGIGFMLSVRKLAPEYLDWLYDLEWFGEEQAAAGLLAESNEESRVHVEPNAATLPRPWVWDLTATAMMYFAPQPSAWGATVRFSLIPKADAKLEFKFWAQTIGWTWAWYMGPGNDSPTDYRHPREGEEVSLTWHRYALRHVGLGTTVDLAVAGPLRITPGLRLDLDGVEVREGTLLARDVAAGTALAPPLSFAGSGDIGLMLDSRDERHDPTRGGTASGVLSGTVSTVGVSARLTVDVRGYLGLGPGAPVVLAGNVAANLQVGTLRFFELGVMASPTPRPRLITGVGALRGLQRGRLRGPLALLLLSEVRFRPPGFAFGRRGRLRLEPVVFADAARVDEWDRLGAGLPLHPGLGGGLRAILNEQLVVYADVGTSPDDIIDAEGVPGSVWVVGAYLSVGQYF